MAVWVLVCLFQGGQHTRLYLAWHISDEHSTYIVQLGKRGRDTQYFCQNKVRLSQLVPLWAPQVFLFHLYQLDYTAILWLVQVQDQNSPGCGLFPGLFSLHCSEFYKRLWKQISPSKQHVAALAAGISPTSCNSALCGAMPASLWYPKHIQEMKVSSEEFTELVHIQPDVWCAWPWGLARMLWGSAAPLLPGPNSCWDPRD